LSMPILASTLLEKDQRSNTIYMKFNKEIFNYLKLTMDSEKFYFEQYQREEIIRISSDFLTGLHQVFPEYKKLASDKNIFSKKNRDFVKDKALYYKWLSKFVEITMHGGNALVSVVSEGSINFKDYAKAVLKQGSQVRGIGRDKRHEVRDYLRVIDMYKNLDKLFNAHSFNSTNKDLVDFAIAEYIDSLGQIKELVEEVDYKVGSYSIFYHLKVFLLKAASYIALPGKHKISAATLNQIDEKLTPGDIGVIQRYNKLSNIVFKGNWTHSLMYLGKFSKFQNYFDNDLETRVFYLQRCISEDLLCSDFVTYMELKYPEAMKKYSDGEYKKDPIITIESLKPGVILYNQKKSMGWDNLAIFRPRLSILDKARSIDAAFSRLGLPYDYNFNGHTQERLVCTELISYAYQADPRISKKGINWEMNFVMNHPVMYAFDIVETYFKRKGKAEQQLDLVIYIRGEDGEFGKSRIGSEKELLETVDLRD